MTKILVGRTSDIPDGKMVHLMRDKKKDILVVNIEGNYYAISNVCTHEGARLHEGSLNDRELTCPWHGAKWDVTTGKLILFSEKLKSLRSFKVSIENDSVYVEG